MTFRTYFGVYGSSCQALKMRTKQRSKQITNLNPHSKEKRYVRRSELTWFSPLSCSCKCCVPSGGSHRPAAKARTHKLEKLWCALKSLLFGRRAILSGTLYNCIFGHVIYIKIHASRWVTRLGNVGSPGQTRDLLPCGSSKVRLAAFLSVTWAFSHGTSD